jgi:hypothetical protein
MSARRIELDSEQCSNFTVGAAAEKQKGGLALTRCKPKPRAQPREIPADLLLNVNDERLAR